MKNKTLSLLGLAYRARKVIIGEKAILEVIQNNQARLIIIASDSSQLTKKKITDKCKYYHIKYICLGRKDELGKSIGKELVSILAIIDDGFVKLIHENENLSEVKHID